MSNLLSCGAFKFSLDPRSQVTVAISQFFSKLNRFKSQVRIESCSSPCPFSMEEPSESFVYIYAFGSRSHSLVASASIAFIKDESSYNGRFIIGTSKPTFRTLFDGGLKFCFIFKGGHDFDAFVDFSSSIAYVNSVYKAFDDIISEFNSALADDVFDSS